MHKIILSFSILFCAAYAEATIILNTNAGLGAGDGIAADYTLFAYSTVATDTGFDGGELIDWNGTQLNHLGGTMGGASLTLTLSSFGAEIGSGTPFNFASTIDVGYGDFYFSVVATGYDTSEGKGWVLLNNSPSGLSMVSSAMEYGSSTLTVGAIPEPASLGLLSLSGVLIYLSRNKMRK